MHASANLIDKLHGNAQICVADGVISIERLSSSCGFISFLDSFEKSLEMLKMIRMTSSKLVAKEALIATKNVLHAGSPNVNLGLARDLNW